MTHYLPPQLLSYFEPRPPLTHLPFNDPIDQSKPKTCQSINGVAGLLDRFKEYSQRPKPINQPTKQQIKQIHTANAIKRHQRHLNSRIAKYNPKAINQPTTQLTDQSADQSTIPSTNQPTHSVDAYKTLFVGRLNYSLTESDIAKEFEYYGSIVSCRLVRERKPTKQSTNKAIDQPTDQPTDKSTDPSLIQSINPSTDQPTAPSEGKSRGYAFIQFASSKDLSEAFRDADGRKIAGRRIVVDVERGRTVKNWKPRRLGGGLGGTRAGARHECRATSGRDVAAIPEKKVPPPVIKGIHPDRAHVHMDRQYDRYDHEHDRDRDRDRDRERDWDREYRSSSYRERERDDGYRTRARSRSPHGDRR